MTGGTDVLMWAAGVAIAVLTAICGHLYKRISDVQESMERSLNRQLADIRTSLRDVRTEIDIDRKASADDRVRIAGTMVTREQLERQTDLLLQEFRQRLPTRHPPAAE